MNRKGALIARIGRHKVALFVGRVVRQTMQCRREHQCHIWPFEYGAVITVLAAGISAKRVLELGTGLGYATLWLAHGARAAHIDTIERDALHVELARANFRDFGCSDRVTVHAGEFEDILPTFTPGYDLALFDGWGPQPRHLTEFARLLRVGGVLVSSNLGYAAQTDSADGVWTREYCEALYDEDVWYTSLLDDSTALSVRA